MRRDESMLALRLHHADDERCRPEPLQRELGTDDSQASFTASAPAWRNAYVSASVAAEQAAAAQRTLDVYLAM